MKSSSTIMQGPIMSGEFSVILAVLQRKVVFGLGVVLFFVVIFDVSIVKKVDFYLAFWLALPNL